MRLCHALPVFELALLASLRWLKTEEQLLRGGGIYLYVNTRLLTQLKDQAILEGYIGLYVASIAAGNVRIRFDNLEVREAQ